MTPRSVLVIEDDPDIARLLTIHLSDLGYAVRIEQGGIHGLATARSDSPDLIVLDLTLPGMDGIEVCRRLRDRGDVTPILMLTSRSSVEDRVLGMDTGADDYVIKPFSVREFLSRVKAIFRRLDADRLDKKKGVDGISVGSMVVNAERRQVTVDGEIAELTAREYELLLLLMGHPGRVYSRAQLLDMVWGQYSASQEHAVNSHINRLRAKIERDPANPQYVLTVWGIGYKFNDMLAQ